MRRIVLFAHGSRGDVQPFLAIGAGLRARGHEVRVVTTLDFASLVEAYGLQPFVAPIDVQAALKASTAAVEGGGVLASFRAFADLAARSSRVLVTTGLAAAQGADLIVAGFGGWSLATGIAERLGLPYLQAYNVPITPTSAFPGALFPGWPKPLWRLGGVLSRQAVWQSARMGAAGARREVLGLPPDPWFGDLPALREGPIVYGLSEALLPRPPDWDARIRMTGFWFAPEPGGFEPDPALAAFLEEERPIYVGFGSMSTERPQQTLRAVLDALGGRPAVVHTGWAGLGGSELPPKVRLVGSLPHAWLFDRVRAVVHHGGAGTTAAGLRAGLPTVVVPFHGDQPFWGWLVAARGLGPPPIPRTRLNARRLGEALDRATGDPEVARRAAELGQKLRAEDGVGAAVALIEERAC